MRSVFHCRSGRGEYIIYNFHMCFSLFINLVIWGLRIKMHECYKQTIFTRVIYTTHRIELFTCCALCVFEMRKKIDKKHNRNYSVKGNSYCAKLDYHFDVVNKDMYSDTERNALL